MNNQITNPALYNLQRLLESPHFQRLATSNLVPQPFNIFDVTGPASLEVRHTKFLTFLLDPRQTHGLGSAFACSILGQISGEQAVHDLPHLEVRREWKHIDILLLDSFHHLAIIIENKVQSGEHSDQLNRYWQTVEQHYPGWHIRGIYLSPKGQQPSSNRYQALSYRTLCTLIEDLAMHHIMTLPPDVRTYVQHYTQLLRRDIVGSSDAVVQLCREIYRSHKQALDLIYSHLPNRHEEVVKLVTSLIKETPSLKLTGKPQENEVINFAFKAWEVTQELTKSTWPYSKHMLLFEFVHILGSEQLILRLYISPGQKKIRDALLSMTQTNQPLFQIPREIPGKWLIVFERTLLDKPFYNDATDAKVEEILRQGWSRFVEHDLAQICTVVQKQAEIWTTERNTINSAKLLSQPHVPPAHLHKVRPLFGRRRNH